MATPVRSWEVAVTCAQDGRDHLVSDEAMAAGLSGHAGRYVALCGHRVSAAVLACPPGPPCSRCVALWRAWANASRPVNRHQRRHHRPPRLGVVTRLVPRVLRPSARTQRIAIRGMDQEL